MLGAELGTVRPLSRESIGVFERYGRVATVHMMTERGSGRSRGFAFVGMGSFEDADEAITRLNGASLGGRNLVVNPAEERDRPVAARTPNILDLL